jgi:hypothetical protein
MGTLGLVLSKTDFVGFVFKSIAPRYIKGAIEKLIRL